MIHKTIKNLIRNILLQTERKESISKWYAFLITLSSKTIPSIFKMNNLPCYYNTAIFRMGITNHLVAVPSEKHLYPFSAVIVSLDQFFIQKVLSYYVSRLNVFIWSRSELHSWKLFAKTVPLSPNTGRIKCFKVRFKDTETRETNSTVSCPSPLIKTGSDKHFWDSGDRARKARAHHPLQIMHQKAK